MVVSSVDYQQQKMQENAIHQCRNLDRAFAVSADVPRGPVLLVDDAVDSEWTLTVIAVLLRRAGSDPVHPVAFASTGLGS